MLTKTKLLDIRLETIIEFSLADKERLLNIMAKLKSVYFPYEKLQF